MPTCAAALVTLNVEHVELADEFAKNDRAFSKHGQSQRLMKRGASSRVTSSTPGPNSSPPTAQTPITAPLRLSLMAHCFLLFWRQPMPAHSL